GALLVAARSDSQARHDAEERCDVSEHGGSLALLDELGLLWEVARMATIDADHQDLVYRTLVIGGGSQLFVESLHLDNGGFSPGEVQGWRPRFTFDTFPADPWA